MRITPKIKKITEEYFKKVFPGISDTLAISATLTAIAKVTTHNRLYIDFIDRPILTNYFDYRQGRSGVGKDLLNMWTEKLIEPLIDTYDAEIKEWVSIYNGEVVDFVEKRQEFRRFGTKKKRELYIESHSLDIPNTEIPGGSGPAFFKQRYILQKIVIGACTFVEDEFLDFVENTQNNDFLKELKSAYEKGKSRDKPTLYRPTYHSKNVPQNATFYSSNPDGTGLENFWKRGMGRRCMIHFFKDADRVKLSAQEKRKNKTEAKAELPEIQQMFNALDKAIRADYRTRRGGISATVSEFDTLPDVKFFNPKMRIDDEIEDRIEDFKEDCLDAIFDDEAGDPLEMDSRSWKTLRLAANIAALEHPEDLQIFHSDLDFAMDYVNALGEDYEEVTTTKIKTDIGELFDRMHKSKKFWNLTDIRESGIFPKSLNSNILQDKLTALGVMCEDKDMILIKEEKGKSEMYKVGEKPSKQDLATIRKELKIEGEPKAIITHIDVPHEQGDSHRTKVSDITKCCKNISPIEFMEFLETQEPFIAGHASYRDGKHNKKIVSTIFIDIDNTMDAAWMRDNMKPEILESFDMNKGQITTKLVFERFPEEFKRLDEMYPKITLDEFNRRYQNLARVTQPSKSHQKAKEMFGARDRFHAFLFLDNPVNLEGKNELDASVYKRFMENTYEILGLTEYADPAHVKASQLFYGTPHKPQYYEGNCLFAGKLLDVRMVNTDVVQTNRMRRMPELYDLFKRLGTNLPRGGSAREKCPLHSQTSASPSFTLYRGLEDGLLHAYCHGACVYKGRIQLSIEQDKELKR